MAIEVNTNKSRAVANESPIKITFKLPGRKKVSNKDRLLFVEQLALLLETGNDLRASLNVLGMQTENPEMVAIINSVSEEVYAGKTFSSALSKHPAVFSSTFVSLIAASESGGYLQRILEHLLAMEKQRNELKKALLSALSYPLFLIVFSFAVVVFILTVVFPKFAILFTTIQDQLPVTTLFLMSLSDVITHYWWAVIACCLTIILLFFTWVKSTAGSTVLDRFKLKAPVIKDIFLKLYLIQTMRVLGLSLTNGVTLLSALVLAKDAVKNNIFHGFLDKLIDDVTQGRLLATGFNEAEFIPPMVRQMISTGEETGNLALVTTRLADYIQIELEQTLKFVTKTIEPLMLLVMGVIVGTLVSSLILPIFKLSSTVH